MSARPQNTGTADAAKASEEFSSSAATESCPPRRRRAASSAPPADATPYAAQGHRRSREPQSHAVLSAAEALPEGARGLCRASCCPTLSPRCNSEACEPKVDVEALTPDENLTLHAWSAEIRCHAENMCFWCLCVGGVKRAREPQLCVSPSDRRPPFEERGNFGLKASMWATRL